MRARWAAAIAALARAADYPGIDYGRVSAIGWTDAHNVAYGLPLDRGSAAVPREDAAAFLAAADDAYLCARNDYGQTALHLAVRQNNVAVVDLYARRRLCLDAANADGDTPLHYAAVFQRLDAVWMLLGAGADPSAENADGDTPADDAASNRATAVVGIVGILRAAAANPPRPPGAPPDPRGRRGGPPGGEL
jgi:hypothetical protein